MPLKQTAFSEIHRRLNGKMVEFAGFEMPIQYSGIVEEHRRVREHVGVFDVSHMGEVEIRGRDALSFIQRLTVNDAAKLAPGRIQYSAMCYDNGGIVDDLLVYHLGPDAFMLVINAANTAKDIEWMRQHASGDVTIVDRTDETSLLAVQGPQSLPLLQKLTNADLAGLQYYHFTKSRLCDVEMIISRTGYTGELGFELYFPSNRETGEKIWNALFEAGHEFGVGPVGLGARDTLRLEMGFCLYGHDIDQTTNPLEAGLGWITKLGKEEFIGRSAMMEVTKAGLRRKLVGFSVNGKAFPRQGYPIHVQGAPAGTVTSGTFSPTLDRGIGMGYVPIESSKPGTSLDIMIRGRAAPATVVALPFLKK